MTMARDCVIQECLPENRSDYEALLFDYAVGALDEALSLMVAAHLTLSPCARKRVAGFEALGGALIERTCAPVPMSSACMEKLMARLDEAADEMPCTLKAEGRPDGLALPGPLCTYISSDPLRWKRYKTGMSAADIRAGCGKFKVRLVRLAPQTRVPAHSHRGIEVMLVLEGSFADDRGTHRRGDLVVHAGRAPHGPGISENGCLCLTLTEKPLVPCGWLARAINLFLRF